MSALRWEVHVQTPPRPPYARARELWCSLEDAGYDALWTWDHYYTETTSGDYDGWTLLAGLAEATHRARLGVLVTAVTFRHPALLARIATTVDHVSDGRLIVGLGAARLASEHETFGVPYPTTRVRIERLEETCRVMEGMWRGEPFSFSGDHVQLRDATGFPRPLQTPRPQVLVGGHGPRIMRVAARHADWWNGFGTPDDHRALNQRLDAVCAAERREPRTLRRLAAVWQAHVTADTAAQYREAGADGVVVIAHDDDISTLARLYESLCAPA
jgi:alkanesulfonate monooxygenase SsuD/methylene tetrahydromethanopterin reductase-like flavin-dependent oxidoreductase (luciferase family)